MTANATDQGGSNLHATAHSFDNGATWQAANTKIYSTNGTYAVNVKARDAAGNISGVFGTYTVKVDKDKPIAPTNVALTSPTTWQGPTDPANASITVSGATDPWKR